MVNQPREGPRVSQSLRAAISGVSPGPPWLVRPWTAGATKRSPPGARPRRRGGARWGWISPEGCRRGGTGLCCLAAPGRAEQRHEWLFAGVGQIRVPAFSGGAEHPVVVDADDAADPDAFGSLQLGEGAVEIGSADTLLSEHDLSLRAVEVVQPVAARPDLDDHGTRPMRASRGPRGCSGDPVHGAATLGARLVRAHLARAGRLDREAEFLF
jgi:hypothetical protein